MDETPARISAIIRKSPSDACEALNTSSVSLSHAMPT